MPKIIDLPGGFLVASDDDKPIRILKNADEVYEYLTGRKPTGNNDYNVSADLLHGLYTSAHKRDKVAARERIRDMCPGMGLLEAKNIVEAFFGRNPNTWWNLNP